MKPRRAKEQEQQELIGRTRLLRAWKNWYAEQLEEALAGVHHDVLERLIAQLKQLHPARELVNFISAQDWSAIDADTRLICLHEINTAISALRQSRGLDPIDPLPGAPDNAFLIIKALFESFPSQAGEHTEVSSVNKGV